MSEQPLVWLITGTSTGIGRALTLEALKRGDKVIATTRASSFSKIDDLKSAGADTLELDVTDSVETIQNFAKNAVKTHNRLDVIVNNAGEAFCLADVSWS
jgi:NAD(P)-dependent dehydrogenase (short-subunit alcohol dehydrogenase family)